MIEIDPRNGKILQQIDLNKVENQYRMAHSQSQYNSRTIFLGRNGKDRIIINQNRFKKAHPFNFFFFFIRVQGHYLR